jgi:hypothetical protein
MNRLRGIHPDKPDCFNNAKIVRRIRYPDADGVTVNMIDNLCPDEPGKIHVFTAGRFSEVNPVQDRPAAFNFGVTTFHGSGIRLGQLRRIADGTGLVTGTDGVGQGNGDT